MNDDLLVPITEAKARLTELVRQAADRDVTLMKHGHPTAIIVGIARYRALLDELEDLDDRLSVYEAREQGTDTFIPFDKALVELGYSGGRA